MLPAVVLLLTSIASLEGAPIVVRGEVVARGGEGAGAWTTIVLDRILLGQPGRGAVTFIGAPGLAPGDRVVVPLERRGDAFAVPAGAAPVAVHTTQEIEAVEDAVLAMPPPPSHGGRVIAAIAAALAVAGLLAIGLRRAAPRT